MCSGLLMCFSSPLGLLVAKYGKPRRIRLELRMWCAAVWWLSVAEWVFGSGLSACERVGVLCVGWSDGWV